MNPPKDKGKWNQLFMTMGIINKKEGTNYADLTGKFPITSMEGMQAIFIMYGPHSRGCGKIPTRVMPRHRQRAYEETRKRY